MPRFWMSSFATRLQKPLSDLPSSTASCLPLAWRGRIPAGQAGVSLRCGVLVAFTLVEPGCIILIGPIRDPASVGFTRFGHVVLGLTRCANVCLFNFGSRSETFAGLFWGRG